MNIANEKANALRDASPHLVRDWPTNGRRSPEPSGLPPKDPGVYMFSDPDGQHMYVGSGVGDGGIRKRLDHQVYARRINAPPWTMSDPPVNSVLKGRNLLCNVLKEILGVRPQNINPKNEDDVNALNEAMNRIGQMTVQWVVCPNRSTAIRAEHCAICKYQPRYVEK